MTADLAAYRAVAAPPGTTRLVPSRFPPVAAFDGVASAEDLDAVMFLEGWTNDRLTAPRLKRLDRSDWVFGRPNSSVVMAAFLHGSPGGMRFSDANLGAWYASTEVMTALLEVANGLRRELALSALTRIDQTYRQYVANLGGRYADIFGVHPEFHNPDPASYPAPQAFGEAVRQDGPALGIAGIRYESTRRRGHDNWVCYRPPLIEDVRQGAHYRVEVPASGSVIVRQLSQGSI